MEEGRLISLPLRAGRLLRAGTRISAWYRGTGTIALWRETTVSGNFEPTVVPCLGSCG